MIVANKERVFVLDINQTLLEAVIRLRKERGWTQAELANKIGISRSHMNKLESGKLQLSLVYLKQLSKIFHISLAKLFGEEERSMKMNKKDFQINVDAINKDILSMEVDQEYSLVLKPSDLTISEETLATWKENCEAGSIVVGSQGCRYLVLSIGGVNTDQHGYTSDNYGFVNIDHANWGLCEPRFDSTDELVEWFVSRTDNPIIDILSSKRTENNIPGKEWI